MRRLFRLLVLAACVLAMVAYAPAAGAGHDTDPRTANLVPLGHIVEPAIFGGFGGVDPDIHTDIAFWGNRAFQGNWDGFNIRDISNANNPTTISRTFCDGNQGDVVVWDNVLVRSWNSPAPKGSSCDGRRVRTGFEGLHVFDISNLSNPALVASVPTPCGSHTATGVPDLANNRLLVYNSASSSACPQIDIVSVPLDDPGSASLLRSERSARSCHDTGVILGKAMLAACAGGNGFTVWSLDPADGGSLVNPELRHSITVPGVTIGHSAGFTWDGEVLLFGHEPGGGVAAECEATDDEVKKTLFFFDADTGRQVGKWVLPRPQSATENCTIHNYNVVPLKNRYVVVHGSYQSGTSAVDFTDPANAVEIAWSDPPPRPVPPGTPFCCDVGGAWSSYWYDGFIYETNINEGLNIFELVDRAVRGAVRLGHLNPQTQEFTLP
jgi:hypothetical protein